MYDPGKGQWKAGDKIAVKPLAQDNQPRYRKQDVAPMKGYPSRAGITPS